MTEIQVKPLVSLNGVKLGWTRNELYDKFGRPERTIEKTDYYQVKPVFLSVHFDASERIEYLEISNPKSDLVHILLKEMNVFQKEASHLIEEIRVQMGIEYDKEEVEIPYSYIFPEAELSFWRPTIPENVNDEDGRYFETIGIGIKGYYSN